MPIHFGPHVFLPPARVVAPEAQEIFNDSGPLLPHRLTMLDAYGTADVSFATNDDGNEGGPRGVIGRRPQRLAERTQSRVGGLIDRGTAPELPTHLPTAAELNEELALEFTRLLLGVALDEAGGRLQARAHAEEDVDEEARLRGQLAEIERALRLAEQQLSGPQALANRDVRLRIIRGLFEYFRAYPALQRRYAAIINPLARYLSIGHGDWIAVGPGRGAAVARVAREEPAAPLHTPLAEFAGKSWKEICELCGFDPRHYQEAWYEALLLRATQGGGRAILGAPYQTGKTFVCFPLAAALGTTNFPDKTILIVAPQRVVKDTIMADLSRVSGGLRIGRIDAVHKDYGPGFDVAVASLWTVGRAENLNRLDQTLYGVVATDEAKALFSPTGRGLLTRLGFLDAGGGIRQERDRFLFGFSADASLYDFSPIFGPKARADDLDLPWYIRNRHLHEPIGINSPYRKAISGDSWEVVTEGGALFAYPKEKLAMVAEVYRDYKQHFDGKRVVIAWPSIVHAEVAAAYFNTMEGRDGFAYAHHSDKSLDDNRAAERGFQSAQGPTVLHGVKTLSVGFRAQGAVGIIFPYMTTSPSLAGQWLGRILGIHGGEPQRQVTVLQKVGWSGRFARRGITLAQLMGIENYPGDNVVYRPLQLLAGQRQKPQLPTRFTVRAVGEVGVGLDFAAVEEATEVVYRPTRFPALLQEALDREFVGDMAAMAVTTRESETSLNDYMTGQMPKDYERVWWLANTLYPDNPARLVSAWVEDFVGLMEVTYRLELWVTNDSAVRELIQILRRASLTATYDREQGARFANGLELDRAEAMALGHLIRGELLTADGQPVLAQWRELAGKITVSARELDDELASDLIERAASEIAVEAKSRQERQQGQRGRGDDAAAATASAEEEAIKAALALFPDDGTLSLGPPLWFYELLAALALFPDEGTLTLGRRLQLYETLGLFLRQYKFVGVPARHFVDLRKWLTRETNIPRSALRLGDLVNVGRERLEAEAPELFGRFHAKTTGFITDGLARQGLRIGMNTRGWQEGMELSSDRDALFAIFDRPIEDLELGPEMTASLKGRGMHFVGDAIGRGRKLELGMIDGEAEEALSTALRELFELDFLTETFSWKAPPLPGDDGRYRELVRRVDAGEIKWWEAVGQFNGNVLLRVDDLDLSVNSSNCLQNAGFEFIWQLCERSEAELLKTKNFGRKSLNEIKEILSDLDLNLGMWRSSAWREFLAARLLRGRELEGVDPSGVPHSLKRVDELDLSVRAKNCLQNAGIEFVWQICEMSEADLLKIQNFGRKSLNEIKEILADLGLHLRTR